MMDWLASLWRRLMDWIAVPDPFDLPTDWQESQPETVWPEISKPGELEHKA